MQVVATIGLHGSASTWVFNVARELLIAAHGPEQVLAIYADAAGQVPEADGRVLVIKSHHGSPGFDPWLVEMGALALLSVRDPRDAAISMAQRFKAPLANAVRWLMTDCARMQRLVAAGHPVFRYEDGFFDDPAATDRLRTLLGLTLDAALVEAVSARYRTEAVRQFTRTIEALPADRVVRSGAIVFDQMTQIHVTHIGDARNGKWRELPEAVQVGMTRSFRPFLEALGYPF